MNKIIGSLTLILTLLALPLTVYSQTPPATDSAQLDTIKENVIKRIQEVVQDKTNNPQTQLVAWIGTLYSITGNTLNIQANDDTRLASTSAQTAYVRIPGNTTIEFDDLSIDEYTIAIGTLKDTEVLNTLRVIVQTTPPPPPSYKVVSGLVIAYDETDFTLNLQAIGSEPPQVYTIGRSTDVFLISEDGTKSPSRRTESIPPQSHVLVVYGPHDEGDDIIASEVLINPPFPMVTPAEIAP